MLFPQYSYCYIEEHNYSQLFLIVQVTNGCFLQKSKRNNSTIKKLIGEINYNGFLKLIQSLNIAERAQQVLMDNFPQYIKLKEGTSFVYDDFILYLVEKMLLCMHL